MTLSSLTAVVQLSNFQPFLYAGSENSEAFVTLFSFEPMFDKYVTYSLFSEISSPITLSSVSRKQAFSDCIKPPLLSSSLCEKKPLC